jgi:tetratricopeptide (TPR) repeat protein
LKVLARRLNRPLSHFLEGVPEDGEAEAFLRLGLAHLRTTTAEGAGRPLEKALEVAVQQGDEVLQARIELALAMFDQRLGHGSRAQRRLERCFRVLVRADDAALLAAAHGCLGRIRLESGDVVSALWAFQTAIQLAEQTPDDPALRSRLYLELGITHRKLGNVQAAREAFHQGLEIARPFRDHYRVAARYLGLADAAVGRGRFEQAFDLAGKALVAHETLGHMRQLAEIHERLGEIDGEEECWEDAKGHYRWSIVLNAAAANLPGVAQTLSSLSEALLERASPLAAQTICEAALELLTAETDCGERAHVLRVLGTIYQALERHAEAKSAFQESLALSAALHREHDARLAHQGLALLALDAEDLVEARQHLKLLREASRKF